MFIQKLVIKNFKLFEYFEIDFNSNLSILVGDNESGKSTLLEAIKLVMSGQFNGRSIQYELNPFLFNKVVIEEYVNKLKNGEKIRPPDILIEVYLENLPEYSQLKGTNNTHRSDQPGVYIKIEFDENYTEEYKVYISDPSKIQTIPIEYYTINWFSFANNRITARAIPINLTFIDTTLIRIQSGPDKYILQIIDGTLTTKDRVDLSLTYRQVKELFSNQLGVKGINEFLAKKKGEISDKELSISLDISQRSTWESNLTSYLDNIPFTFIGKGEQSQVKIKLAMESNLDESNIFLLEEPENHLSYSNMNGLLNKIEEKYKGKQIFITTHSSFVLNKLGVDKVILLANNQWMTLDDLSPDTKEYFMKLPGYDTLRLLLAERVILVEGPSDELILQKAYLEKHKMLPIANGMDVISVNALAFKRFLDIAKNLKKKVSVITDNDGNIEKLKNKYADYETYDFIKIYYDSDENFKSLEHQILKANSLEKLNQVFNKTFSTESELISFMTENKTDCALKIFSSSIEIKFPEYIERAITE